MKLTTILNKISKEMNAGATNEYFEGFIYKLSCSKTEDKIFFKVYCDDVIYKDYVIYVEDMEIDSIDVNSITKGIISYMYSTEINECNKVIKKENAFNKRKAKQLEKYYDLLNEDKINNILAEVVANNRLVRETKRELEDLKEIVRDLYRVRWELSPNWKCEEIVEKIREILYRKEFRNGYTITCNNKDNSLEFILYNGRKKVGEYFTRVQQNCFRDYKTYYEEMLSFFFGI